jgi:hypothetical protein
MTQEFGRKPATAADRDSSLILPERARVHFDMMDRLLEASLAKADDRKSKVSAALQLLHERELISQNDVRALQELLEENGPLSRSSLEAQQASIREVISQLTFESSLAAQMINLVSTAMQDEGAPSSTGTRMRAMAQTPRETTQLPPGHSDGPGSTAPSNNPGTGGSSSGVPSSGTSTPGSGSPGAGPSGGGPPSDDERQREKATQYAVACFVGAAGGIGLGAAAGGPVGAAGGALAGCGLGMSVKYLFDEVFLTEEE